MTQQLFIGADHRGFQLKEALKHWLEKDGYQVEDCGNTVLDLQDDYPDYAFAVAKKVATTDNSLGIVVCGSGIGVNVAANKVPGVRASVGTSPEEIAQGRNDDDLNVLALSADFISATAAKELVTAFITTPYAAEDRFMRRLAKIKLYEQHA